LPTAPRYSPLAPLREGPFVACWLGSAISASANWMLGLTVPFLVYEMTESTTWLGIAAIAANGPAIVASPLGGVWADRYSKRTVLLAVLTIQIGIASWLFATAQAGQLTVGWLIGLAAAMGFASTTHLSAYQPFLAEIVPAQQIAAAYRLNAIQFNVSRAIGPAVAGFVLAQWGPATAFAVNAVAYLPLAGVLVFVRPRPLERPAPKSVVSDLVAGARTIWHDRRLRFAAATSAITALFGMSVHPLMAGLAKSVFRVDEQGLGILVSSVGVAAVVTALVTVGVGERLRRSTMVQIGLVMYGGGLWVVAATDIFTIGIIGFAITGIAHVLVNVTVTTSVQIHVEEAFRGRVTSLQLMAIILAMPIGAQVGGLLGDGIGLPAALALYGGALVGYALWAHLRMNGLRDLD